MSSPPSDVNGSALSIDTSTVVAWTAEMCRLEYSHDCEFDGWGTSSELPELRDSQ
ncbi:MAG TPA: hypothetical protein VF395_13235 [Polyangiaceae bacterium]